MAEVNNHDIVLVSSKLVRMIAEAEHAASANVSVLSSADQTRFEQYLTSLDQSVEWIQAEPELDLPETHPIVWQAQDPPEQIVVENEGINQLSRIWRLARDEMVNSQSARLSCRLLDFDKDRLTAVIEKSRKFLTDFLAQQQAQDLPESSPQEAVAPAGRTGTKQRT